MSAKTSVLLALAFVLVNTVLSAPAWGQTVQTPTEFFGFEIGTDGEGECECDATADADADGPPPLALARTAC